MGLKKENSLERHALISCPLHACKSLPPPPCHSPPGRQLAQCCLTARVKRVKMMGTFMPDPLLPIMLDPKRERWKMSSCHHLSKLYIQKKASKNTESSTELFFICCCRLPKGRLKPQISWVWILLWLWLKNLKCNFSGILDSTIQTKPEQNSSSLAPRSCCPDLVLCIKFSFWVNLTTILP